MLLFNVRFSFGQESAEFESFLRPGDEENDEFPTRLNEGSLQSVSTDVDLALEATEDGICFMLCSLKEF